MRIASASAVSGASNLSPEGVAMPDNDPRPQWGILYAVLPMTVGLFVLEVNTTMPPVLHQVAEVGILLFAFACVELWLSANTLALIRGDEPRRELEVARPDKTRLYVVSCDSSPKDRASASVRPHPVISAPVYWLRSVACHFPLHLW
jgi:hypothetical protein